jgi:hypothetical protein
MFDPLSPAASFAGMPNQQAPQGFMGHALQNFGIGVDPNVLRFRQHMAQPHVQPSDLMAMALYGPQASGPQPKRGKNALA